MAKQKINFNKPQENNNIPDYLKAKIEQIIYDSSNVNDAKEMLELVILKLRLIIDTNVTEKLLQHVLETAKSINVLALDGDAYTLIDYGIDLQTHQLTNYANLYLRTIPQCGTRSESYVGDPCSIECIFSLLKPTVQNNNNYSTVDNNNDDMEEHVSDSPNNDGSQNEVLNNNNQNNIPAGSENENAQRRDNENNDNNDNINDSSNTEDVENNDSNASENNNENVFLSSPPFLIPQIANQDEDNNNDNINNNINLPEHCEPSPLLSKSVEAAGESTSCHCILL